MFNAGAIAARLVLNNSDFNRKADESTSKTQQLARNFFTTGRQLGRLGSQFMMFGGVALSPFILLTKSAAKENIGLEAKISDLTNSFQKLRDELVVYIVPHLDNLTKLVKSAATWFDGLSPRIKKVAADFVVYGSVLLISVGVTMKFVQFLALVNGVLLITIARLNAAIPLMAVFQTFRFMGLTTDIAVLVANVGALYPLVLIVGTAFASWKLGSLIADIEGVSNALSGPDGLFTKMFLWIDSKNILGKMEKLVKLLAIIPGPWQAAASLANAGMNISKGLGQSTQGISSNVDLGKISIEKIVSWIDLAKTKMADFAAGFRLQLSESIKDLANWGKFGKEVAVDMISKMKTVTSDFFYNVFTGQIQSAMDVFAEFGKYILRVISDIIAQFLVMKIVGGFLGMGSGALSTMSSGMVSNSAAALNPSLGFAEGIESVPATGLYKLHSGEEVVPRYDAGNERAIEVTIHNFITPEAVAMAMSGKEGKGVIVNVINEDSLRYGVIKRVVVRR